MHNKTLNFIGVVLLFLIGCQTAVSPQPTPITLQTPPTFTPQPTPPLLPTATPALDEWQSLQAGIERRIIALMDENGRIQDRLHLVRIDQSLRRFEIAYAPGEPKAITSWRTELGADVVVNGSFFTPEYVATGRIIINGQASGQSYGDFAGMVAIVDGVLQVRDLAERPYSASEALDFGLQAFPVLIKSGGVQAYFDDGESDRRTVIGVDKNGRVLLIVSQLGSFSLAEMSHWLANSDLELDVALNLDGGTSSSLAIAGGETAVGFLPIPNVIAVFPK